MFKTSQDLILHRYIASSFGLYACTVVYLHFNFSSVRAYLTVWKFSVNGFHPYKLLPTETQDSPIHTVYPYNVLECYYTKIRELFSPVTCIRLELERTRELLKIRIPNSKDGESLYFRFLSRESLESY